MEKLSVDFSSNGIGTDALPLRAAGISLRMAPNGKSKLPITPSPELERGLIDAKRKKSYALEQQQPLVQD
ncbi:MAG: hypothetical protein QOH41_101 [Blastocatellia bacterium]|jgi:hypothetical protein|nr:hypothetical protein [Blastocatellia bacterium]